MNNEISSKETESMIDTSEREKSKTIYFNNHTDLSLEKSNQRFSSYTKEAKSNQEIKTDNEIDEVHQLDQDFKGLTVDENVINKI